MIELLFDGVKGSSMLQSVSGLQLPVTSSQHPTDCSGKEHLQLEPIIKVFKPTIGSWASARNRGHDRTPRKAIRY